MNPFKKNNQIIPVASINSVYVDDVLASDLFRPSLIFEEIIKNKNSLGLTGNIDNKELSELFNNLLKNDLDTIRNKAYEIAEMFGERLTKVLLTLYAPSSKSILNRKDWDRQHWDYWQTIQNIYFVGGVTSPILTKVFYDIISTTFKENGFDNINITFLEGSSNLGTKGLASIVTDGDYLLFDFGQTKIKRARHLKKENLIKIDTILAPVKSKFLFYKSQTKAEVKQIAKKLDDYIVDVIMDTIIEVNFEGSHMYLAIANYVIDGFIYSARGGYGKLAFIADNYEIHLSQKLTKLLGRNIDVKLFHDTSAMALLYRNKPNTAVISLGTAFGVAFPE